jgi:Flp pilus assembly protein protease CpaA
VTPRQLTGGVLAALVAATVLVRRRHGSLTAFAAAVAEASAQREGELRLALGIDAGGVPAETARRLVQEPAGEHGDPVFP